MRTRDDMVKGIATYEDKRFIDPNYSGVANVAPASITNGATRYQSSGTTLAAIDADVRSAIAMFASSDVDPSTAVWVMPATVALRLSMKRNAYDEIAFPEPGRRDRDWPRHLLRPAGDRLERDGRPRARRTRCRSRWSRKARCCWPKRAASRSTCRTKRRCR
jgi:hypothetical protein